MAYKGDISTYIRSVVNSTNQNISAQVRLYNEQLEKLKDPLKDAGFLEKVAVLGGTGLFSFLDGSWKSITGLVSGIFTALTNSLEHINNLSETELANIASQGVTGGRLAPVGALGAQIGARFNRLDEAGALFVNDLKTTFGVAGVSIGTMVQNIADVGLQAVGVETNWNTQWAQDAVRSLAQIQAKTAYEIKTGDQSQNVFARQDLLPTGQQSAATYVPGLSGVSGLSNEQTIEAQERSAEWFKDAEENYRTYQQYLDENYNPIAREAVDFTTQMKNLTDKLFDNKFFRDLVGKTRADELYGHLDWYHQLTGVISSMAAVITGRLLTTLIPNPTAAAAFGQSYFGIQVFGNSFAEARNNGATLQDAYTYAYANAAIETLIENIGGVTPDGKKPLIPSDFNAFMRFFKTLRKNAFEEGIEEVGSEFATPGFDYFAQSVANQEDFGFERFATETTMKRIITAFAAGAISGGIFGVGQYLMNRNTLNEKINLFQDAKRLKVETPKQRYEASRILKRTSDSLLQALNSPKSKGYKRTKSGKYVIGTLTNADKLAYMYQTGLANIYEINWKETLKVDTQEQVEQATSEQIDKSIDAGNLVFSYVEGVNFEDALFNSYYGKDATGQRIQINPELWAINEATVGVEVENAAVGPEGKDLRLVTQSSLNQRGKQALEAAKRVKIPVVVVSMTPEGQEAYKDTVAFYSNGVIYINQDASGLNKESVRKELIKHELIHFLAAKSPNVYNKLASLVTDVLDVEIQWKNKEGDMVKVKAKKEYSALYKLLEKAGYIAKINASLTDLLNQETDNLQETLTPEQIAQNQDIIAKRLQEKIIEKLREEAVAYFAESVVKDTKEFLQALEGKNTDLENAIEDVFEKRLIALEGGEVVENPFASLSKAEQRIVREFSRQVSTGLKELAEQRRVAEFFINQAFGQDSRTADYIIPAALKKYGEQAIFKALIELKVFNLEQEAEGKPKTDILEIIYKDENGKIQSDSVKVGDIFFFKDAVQIFKKVEVNQPKSEKQAFVDAFVYDPKKNLDYSDALNYYQKSIEAEIKVIENSINVGSQEEIQNSKKRLDILKQRLQVVTLLNYDFERAKSDIFIGISDFAADSVWDATDPKLNLDYVNVITGSPVRPQTSTGVRLKADIKRRVLAWAVFETEKAQNNETKGVKITRGQRLSNAELSAISNILKSLKEFLRKYSPVLSLRTDDWINSAFLSTSSQTGGLNLSLDFLSQLEKEHGALDKQSPNYATRLDNYRKSLENMVENYRSALTVLFSTEHSYTTDSGVSKTRKFDINDYNFEVNYESNDNNVPSILTISIYPTEKLIDAQVNKIKEMEKARDTKETQPSEQQTTAEKRQEQENELNSSMINMLYRNVFKLEKVNANTFGGNNETLPGGMVGKNHIHFPIATSFFGKSVLDIFRDSSSLGTVVNVLNARTTGRNVDTNGKVLTVGQSNFFKDSMLRNQEGSLVVVYHGTRANFENFSAYTTGQVGTLWGTGYYFTPDREYTEQFATNTPMTTQGSEEFDPGIKTRAFYLNLTKPMYEPSGVYYTFNENTQVAEGTPLSSVLIPSFNAEKQNETLSKGQAETIIRRIVELAPDFKSFFNRFKADLAASQRIFFNGVTTLEQFVDAYSKYLFLKDGAENSLFSPSRQYEGYRKDTIVEFKATPQFSQSETFATQFPVLLNHFVQQAGETSVTYEVIKTMEEKLGFTVGAEAMLPKEFVEDLTILVEVALKESSQDFLEAQGQTQLAQTQAKTYEIIKDVSGFDGFINLVTKDTEKGILPIVEYTYPDGADTKTTILVAWFQNQMKAATNYNPDNSINVYAQEDTETSLNVEEISSLRKYDENNIVYLNPFTSLKPTIDAIEEAFKMGPLVAVTVPATWLSDYSYHKALPSYAKVIHMQRILKPVSIPRNAGEKNRKTNMAMMVLANTASQQYATFADLRFTKQENTSSPDLEINKIRKEDDFKAFMLGALNFNSQQLENYRILVYAGFKEGDNVSNNVKLSDYLERFKTTNEDAIKRNSTDLNDYFLPSNVNSGGKLKVSSSVFLVKGDTFDAVKTLDKINFNILADFGTSSEDAFNVFDVVKAYNEAKNEQGEQLDLSVLDKEFMPKKVNVSPLTEERNRLIISLFGTEVVSSLFVADKDGNLKAKFKRFNNKKAINKVFTTESGKKIDGRVYAVNANYQIPEQPSMLERIPDEDYVRIADLTPEQKIYFDTLSAAGFNFGFYKGKDKFLGYSMSGLKTNFFLINSANIGQRLNRIIEIAIHEQFHEIFKANENASDPLGKTLAEILFEKDPTDNKFYPTTIAWQFFESGEFGNVSELNKPFDKKNVYGLNYFINSYLLSVGSYKYMRGIIVSPEDIYDALVTPANDLAQRPRGSDWVRAKNEITAQIIGAMLSDRMVFNTFLKGKADGAVLFLDTFTNIIKNNVHDQAKKDLLLVAAKQYSNINQDLAAELEKKYPLKPLFSNADINNFIRVYTDGLYTTKLDLVSDYLAERAAKKRGKATDALNSLIFIASNYEKVIQTGSETFKELKDYLQNVFDSANYVLNAPLREALFKIKGGSLKVFKNNVKQLQDIMKRIMNGEILYIPESIIPDVRDMDKMFDIEGFVIAHENFLTEFLIEYNEIPAELKKAFSLPSSDVLEKAIKRVFNDNYAVLKTMIDGIKKSQGQVTKVQGLIIASILANYQSAMIPLLNNYEIAVKYLTKGINKVSTTMSNSAAILNQREQIFRKTLEETVILIQQKLKSAITRITTTGLQGQAPISEQLNRIRERISTISRILSSDFGDVKGLETSLITVLNEIVKDGTDIIETKFDVQAMSEEEINAQSDLIESLTFAFNKSIMNAYVQVGLLVGNVESVITNMPSSVATLAEKTEFIKSLQEKASKGKQVDFSPKTLSSALANLVSLYGERYTSSLSDDQKTHDEFAKETNEQFAEYIKNRTFVRDARLDKINFQTPQDYFLKLRTFFKDKNVKLFDILWKNYVKSAIKAEDILRDFDVSYLAFKKEHPTLQKASLEKLDIDENVLLQIPVAVLTQIKIEIAKDQEVIKEKKAKIQEDINITVADKKQINDQIKVLKEQRKQLVRGSFKYQQLSAQIRALEAQKKPFLDKEKQLRADKKAIVELDAPETFKLKVAEYVNQNPNVVGEQAITRGQLINLYLSVLREIEMAEIHASKVESGEVNYINPTNHFGFGNTIDVFDNELLRKEGYAAAKDAATPFIIMLTNKQDLLDYLESLLTEDDRIIIDFAQQQFEINYHLLNAEFKARFGIDLPYQKMYIPFSTIDSDYNRETKLKLVRRFNVGVATGMVTETTTGASNPLKIENIFAVIENHVKMTSRYAYERLIKDWQNLLVNKSYFDIPLQRNLRGKGSNALGEGSNFIDFFNRMFVDILGYSDITEDGWVKFYKKRLTQSRAAVLAFSPTSPLKQLGSILNISAKNKLSFMQLLANTAKTLPKNKYYKWLMENSSNFYFRAKISNVPDLAKEINSSPALKTNNVIDQVLKFGLKGMGYLDAVVIVAAFKTFADDIRTKNKNLTEDEVLEKAYEELFNKVLLFGVANSNPAFRSHFTNDKNMLIQLISKFQSENVLHWSSIIRQLDLVRNKVQGAPKELLREILALLLSSFWSSVVTVSFGVIVGRISQDDIAFESIVNEFIWNNVVGSIPYANSISSLISFDKEAPMLVKEGYEFRLPFMSEVFTIAELLGTGIIYQDSGKVNFRKVLRIFENLLIPFGVPLPNVRKLVELFFSIGGAFGNTQSIDVVQWFAGRSDPQAFTEAIKSNNKTYINNYVEDAFSDMTVVKHISDIVASDSTIRLSLKNEDTFITVSDDGERKQHNVPPSMKSKYRRYTMRAIRKLLSSSKYRRLTPKRKADVLQRVINYYWNFMKDDILNKRKPIETGGNIDEVVERAISYEYQD